MRRSSCVGSVPTTATARLGPPELFIVNGEQFTFRPVFPPREVSVPIYRTREGRA